MRRFCVIIFTLAFIFTLSGCSYETRIDKASIAETVTVEKGENGFVYSFYMLSDSEEPESVSIEGEDFEQACAMAKQKYIPDLSLTKMELFIVSNKVDNHILYDDVSFMASQYYISPRAYIAAADDNTMKFISESKKAPQKIEKHIILQKKEDKENSVNLLSIFNNFTDNENSDFNIFYISSDKELKITPIRISSEK